jgi:hypothetical protein
LTRCTSIEATLTWFTNHLIPAQDGLLAALREQLQSAALLRLPDFFTFIVGEAMLTLDQAPERDARFPVDARLDGRTFARGG